MSSRTRTRSERPRTRAAALIAGLLPVLIAVLCPGAAMAAPVPLPVTAVLVDGAQTSVVVDLSASTGTGRRGVAVTRDGAAQPAKLVPMLSDGLAVALVVDASAAGAPSLPAWLSAGARFILEAPSTTQGVVIADSAPATAVTGPQRGALGVVRALTSVRAKGERDTAAALTLATRQFPDAAPARRMVVLYTTAPDAGGPSADELSTRFRAAGTVLVVVGTADGDRYWAGAAAATGGFFAPAGDPVVIPALDQVETTLRSRYLVQFATPPTLPARVSVRVDTGDLTLTGDATVERVTVPSRPAPHRSHTGAIVVIVLVGAGLLALVAAVILVLRRRRPPPVDGPHEQVARGRAAVPGAPALGRASVPGSISPPSPKADV